MTIRPHVLVTRTISPATSKGRGANIAPKMLTTRSNEPSRSSCRSDASPSWNRQFLNPSASARRFPASTRLTAISTPNTSAPSRAAGTAVVPSPHPRSRTSSPLVIPKSLTSASPLSRMLAAMRVKSPFSHSALLGFIGSLPFVRSGDLDGGRDSSGELPGRRIDGRPHLLDRVHGKASAAPVLADDAFVGRVVQADDLVVADVAVDPLDVGAEG